jgi:hypothetical protein
MALNELFAIAAIIFIALCMLVATQYCRLVGPLFS